MKKYIKLTHLESIMLVLDKLTKNKNKSICYEDIVVAMYKEHPDQFHLKGYPQYPDSEPIGKRISDAKREGLVRSGESKMISITDLGAHLIEDLKKRLKGKSLYVIKKISRISEKEVKRILPLQGFAFFCNGEHERILDTDFYAYLGVSVRTEKNAFSSQVKLLQRTVKEILTISDPKEEIYKKIAEYHSFLLERFKDYLDFKKSN